MINPSIAGDQLNPHPGDFPLLVGRLTEEELLDAPVEARFVWPPTTDPRRAWRLSDHARTQSVKRGLRLSVVLDTVSRPDKAHRCGGRDALYVRSPVALIVNVAVREVLTILLSRDVHAGRWTDEIARSFFVALT